MEIEELQFVMNLISTDYLGSNQTCQIDKPTCTYA